MWCEYTCNAEKYKFVQGIKVITDPETNKEMTQVLFSVDKDYACTMFNSCKKVALIASASLTSSIAFLDFMGYNGKN